MAINLIKDLDFAKKINAVDAVTESGKKMLSNYRGFCYNNPINCATVNNFINEARNNYSFDSGLMSIMSSIESYINENNIRWKLASVCESIESNNTVFNTLNKKGAKKVEKLVEMSESDVNSYIKAGVLKDVQFIPEVRAICREVYGKSVSENKQTVSYNMSTPVSFVTVNENGYQLFNVNGVTFSISESGEIEALVDGVNESLFNKMNNYIHDMQLVGENLEYGYYTGMTGGKQHKFTISEDKIDFTNGNISESFTDVQKFREFVFSDAFAKALNMNEARKFAQIGSAIAEVFENMSDVCILDNVKLFNCANGATVSVIESKNQVNVTLFNSYGRVNESKNYGSMKDAIVEMHNNYNLDVEDLFTARISADIKEGKQKKVDYSDDVNIRLLKIAELTEQFKDDPIKLMILDEMAKELNKMKR